MNNKEKGKKITIPGSNTMDRFKTLPNVFGKEVDKEIFEVDTDKNRFADLEKQKESPINKCYIIDPKYLTDHIFNALTDIGINPITQGFRGQNYIEGSDMKLMNVLYFEGSEPKGEIILLSDWLKKLEEYGSRYNCPEIPEDFIGFEVFYPDVKSDTPKTKNASLDDSDSDSDSVVDGNYESETSDVDDDRSRESKQNEIYDGDYNIRITYDPLTAFRPNNKDCYILFSIENNILSIQHFICPGGGKELLRDTIKVLNKNQRKIGSFDTIELTAADLDPNRFNPNFFNPNFFNPNAFKPKSKTIKDMITEKYIIFNKETEQFEFTEKYDDMVGDGNILIDETGKYRFTEKYRQEKLEKLFLNYIACGFRNFNNDRFIGSKSEILATLSGFVRPKRKRRRNFGGSKKKTKRRQSKKTKRRTKRKSKKRRKSI